MSGQMETLCLHLLDLTRGQKAALEAGNLDNVLALVGKRQEVLREIQKIDSAALSIADAVRAPLTNVKTDSTASVIRQMLSVDGDARRIADARLQDASIKLS